MIKSKKIFFFIVASLLFTFKAGAEIKDALLITLGDRAITKSDIVNEVKIILILKNQSYSDDNRDELNKLAISSVVKRTIKKIEIDRLGFLEFSKRDLINDLTALANRINIDLDTLKNICASNEIDFSLIEDQIKTELLWNSLIFHMYKDRLKINAEEIEEQLKIIQSKEELKEYLISEIIFRPIDEDQPESEIKDLINKIEIEGFENVATNNSISKTAANGGDLGWVSESVISEDYKLKIINTPVGKISEPIFLSGAILIFKVRDIKKIKRNIEEEKNKLVNLEKTKILRMHSSSHYDKLKRQTPINFINE